MLHSNTDAASFKLQPAPRPKKRPANPPPLQPPSSPATPPTPPSDASNSDTTSLRSCFEDDSDPILTPKASLFNGVARRSSRSSTISSSSVSKLLAALSPRSPLVEEKLTVVLTNKSPTPSSPLFPQRTLMRSLSSTCLNSSPTSPSGVMRKRMGWRGALAAQKQQETAILMSPGSPLTPRRAEALHTPTQASISSLLNPDNLTVKEEQEMEPLSATLKALGAKRQTQTLPSNNTLIPVQSPIDEATEVFESLQKLKSPPYPESELDSSRRESFQLLTARKIFHLPTWVRFEANHHARTEAARENRKAAAGFEEMMPKVSHLGDVAPASPNGELFAGFDLNPASTSDKENDEGKEEGVVKVVRRPTMATLRTHSDQKGGKVMGALRSALPRGKYRIKGSLPKRPPSPSPPCSENTSREDRRDGWGGILTRSSWFPGHAKGPLVSPSSPAKKSGLKNLILQPSNDGEWEDLPPSPKREVEGDKSFLELNDAPRFFNRPAQTRRWFRSSPSPTSLKRREEMELNTWHIRPLPASKSGEEEKIESKLITKGNRSIENRPSSKEGMISLKVRVAIFTVTAVLIAAIVINIVVLSHTPSKAGQGPMPNLGIGYIPTPTTSGLDSARQSNIAKAAQLSQP